MGIYSEWMKKNEEIRKKYNIENLRQTWECEEDCESGCYRGCDRTCYRCYIIKDIKPITDCERE
jgi:hypothetical protein